MSDDAGNDCPTCGKRLSIFGDCTGCGWKPHDQLPEDPTKPKGCIECARIRRLNNRDDDFVIAAHCDRCSTHSNSTSPFYDDGDASDRGMRLCPSCWIPALERRMHLDQREHGHRCACGSTVRDHIREGKELMARIEARALLSL
jgi:hypothetical protein